MTVGSFKSSMVLVEKFFKQSFLLKSKGVKPLGETSDEFKSSTLKGNYYTSYQTALRNLDYDFLLKDESFLQFSFSKLNEIGYPTLRYAYYQNPKEFITYEEYLAKEVETSYEEAGDIFIEDYVQFLTEASINSDFTTIRYDLDSKNYLPLIHATSHLHIGNAENIRIPCSKIMTPLSFILFITKHVYYENWKTLLKNDNFYKEYLDVLKPQCSYVNLSGWNTNMETKEFYLT